VLLIQTMNPNTMPVRKLLLIILLVMNCPGQLSQLWRAVPNQQHP